MVVRPGFWKDRAVFVTGHTGFKGGWLCLWLTSLGAKVHGYSLAPPTTPSFFEETKLRGLLQRSTIGDIRDLNKLKNALHTSRASVILHMAAQPLVLESYNDPINTYTTNVIGTMNVYEAARSSDTTEAIVSITTDKCYANREWVWPYRESDHLGGRDPYSSSKACAELLTATYRNSFFSETKTHLASARAGNVIGGGDWAMQRLVPDFFRAYEASESLSVRSPNAVRPWQHVLEPLAGYLVLAEHLVNEGNQFADAWNFGPRESGTQSVAWILEYLSGKLPGASWKQQEETQLHEAGLLKLDSSKANSRLHWEPRWSLETALEKTVDWHLAWKSQQSMAEVSLAQIREYEAS